MKKLILALVFLSSIGASKARIIYVDNDMPADFNNIQAAIDDSNDGDTIIVADGTYTGDGNRDICFFGKAIILQSKNGPEKCIIDCNATQDDQHYGFGFGWGEDSNSVLEGFTIINGWVMGSCGMFLCEYGGILCANSSPTIDHCIIRSNVGYAVYCLNSDVIIKNCTISENKWSLNSAGVYCTNSNLKISNCTVSGNKGRGISCFSSSMIVSKCTISDNNEEAGGDGGGILCGNSHATISYCTIRGNKGHFGGIGFNRTSGTISSCVINRNSGGGIQCYGNSAIKIDSCVIKGNTGFFGGGGIGCSDGSSPMISNCTIVNNHVRQYGGGIYCYWSYPTISNCILWANSTESEGPQIALRHTPSSLTIFFCDVQGGETAAYVEPACTLNWGEGNIDTDPCFADANNDDYHLKSQAGRWDSNSQSWMYDDVTSPCIDAGNPGCPTGNEPAPNGNRINIGTYGGTAQAGKSPPNWRSIADLTNDWIVDSNDLKVFTDYWLQTGECIPSDLNRSQFVDFNDFTLLAGNWGQIRNRAPVANAGYDITVSINGYGASCCDCLDIRLVGLVMMDGSDSYDLDGDALTFTWQAPIPWLVTGIGCYDNIVEAANPTGEFPVGSTTVSLTVSDGELSDTDCLVVTVLPP